MAQAICKIYKLQKPQTLKLQMPYRSST